MRYIALILYNRFILNDLSLYYQPISPMGNPHYHIQSQFKLFFKTAHPIIFQCGSKLIIVIKILVDVLGLVYVYMYAHSSKRHYVRTVTTSFTITITATL